MILQFIVPVLSLATVFLPLLLFIHNKAEKDFTQALEDAEKERMNSLTHHEKN